MTGNYIQQMVTLDTWYDSIIIPTANVHNCVILITESDINKPDGTIITPVNRPFPSSCLPPLQSESKCEVFVMIISSTLHMNEN